MPGPGVRLDVDYLVKIPEDDISGAKNLKELVKLAVALMNV